VPEPPPAADTCAQVGIVGALTGVIGSLMALEAIKHIAQAGETLAGRILLFDGLTSQARTIALARDPACPVCGHS
jgi:bacteriocin biosynthesis cyclodehydratase domain-containing protein